MGHLVAFACCLAGFTALAYATRRPQREIFGRSLGLVATNMLRMTGGCALLFALYVLVAWQGWSVGLVMFSGHTSLAAAIVYCVLVGYARRAPARLG